MSNVNARKPKIAEIDSRKFLSLLNGSAQAKIKFFEEAVQNLGQRQGSQWKLAALLNDKLVIEDVNAGEYLIANYTRAKGGKIAVTEFTKLDICEKQKGKLFESACKSLVDAIEEGDLKNINASYDKIAASRFRSTVVPTSGVVQTRDGETRLIPIKNTVVEESIDGLTSRIIARLSDSIDINEDGQVTSGAFNEEKVVIDVSKTVRMDATARYMRKVATEAYTKPNFQVLVGVIASLICKDKIQEAVDAASKFLVEHQEFCMLTKNDVKTLIDSALATKAVFNEALADDTSELFYATNLKVNRSEILDAWEKTAKKAQDPIMLESVMDLAGAAEFNESYDSFIHTLFESEERVKDLINGLSAVHKALTAKNDGEDDADATEIQDMIEKLKSQPDTNIVYEAGQLLGRLGSDLDAVTDLNDFDSVPGKEELDDGGELDDTADLGEDLGDADLNTGAAADGKNITYITINTAGQPNIEQSNPAPAPVEPAAEPAPEAEPTEGGDDDMADLDALLGTEEPTEEEPKNPMPEGKVQKGQTIAEDGTKSVDEVADAAIADSADDAEDEDEDDLEEDIELEDGEYILPEGLAEGEIDPNYGLVEEEITEDVNDPAVSDALKAMQDEMKKNPNRKWDPKDLGKVADGMLSKNPDASKWSPEDRQKKVQAVLAGVAQPDEAVNENQYKSPTKQLSKRGLKKNAVNNLVKEGSLKWLERAADGVLGQYKGIKFVMDYATPPVMLSADGEVEIPIPESLVAAAMSLAEVKVDANVDVTPFVEWLNENIEQLDLVTEEEDSVLSKEIDEAIASFSVDGVDVTINTNNDQDDNPVIVEPDGEQETPQDEIEIASAAPEASETPAMPEIPEMPEMPSSTNMPMGAPEDDRLSPM